MLEPAAFDWDSLSAAEVDSAQAVAGAFADADWARPLLVAIADNGGLVRASKALLFELRFADALRAAGVVPRYEVPGEGQSTLDFGFTSQGQDWLVELMRLEETQAVQAATRSATDQDGMAWSNRSLSTNAEDRRQSEEGEMLKAVQRICQKCERDGRPHKFPPPENARHVLLVDLRTFLNGGDNADRIHIGLGGEYLEYEFLRRRWEGRLISGAFGPRNTMRGAAELRERVHFIGFVNERTYEPGELPGATHFIANPHAFRNPDEARAIMATWPLQPMQVLNGGR